MAFLDELKKNLTDISENAAERSEEFLKLQKARVRVSSVKRDLKNAYAELGEFCYERDAENARPEEENELREKITDCRSALKEAEDYLTSLTAE